LETATISSSLETLIKEVFAEAAKVESVSVFSRSGIVIVAEAKKLPCRPELLGSMASVAFAALDDAMAGGEQHLQTLVAAYNEKVMLVQPLSHTMLQVAFLASQEHVEDASAAMARMRQRVGSEMSWLR
jgi:predicted regulator of Ras-like GTPase activity (Roadblock/LC7/MglB family)